MGEANKHAEKVIEKLLPDFLKKSGFYTVVATDLNGNYIYVNDVFKKRFSFMGIDFMGQPFGLTLHPDDIETANQAAYTCIHEPEKKVSLQLRKPDIKAGRYYWTQWEFSLLRDSEGNGMGILCMGHDITDYKNVQSAYKENEIRYDLLVQHSQVLMWAGNAQGVFTYASPSWEKEVGYKPSQVVGQRFQQFVHPEDVPICAEALQTALAAKNSITGLQYRVKHGNGKYRWHEATLTPLYETDGSLLQIVGVSRDITDEKKKEKLLQESIRELKLSEGKLKAIYNSINYGLLLISPDYKILSFNKQAGKNAEIVFGKTMKENDSIMEFVIPETRDVFMQDSQIALKGETSRREFQVKGHWFEFVFSSVYADKHKLLGFFMSVISINDRKKAEDTRQELIVAKESANFKQAFLANMSHEIRTPLTAIVGFADLLERTPLNDIQRDYLHSIVQSSKNLNGIVNDILDLSKIEAGKMELKSQLFPLRNLVHEAEELFKSLCNKQIQFDSFVDSTLPEYIVADENRIRQIINNLLSNAIKFTEKGSIAMKIEAPDRAMKSDDLIIKISISDTGKGIDPQMLGKLFIPFSQIDDSQTRQNVGTGLGLSISRELATMLGGEIGVNSEPGSGSVFWFSFLAKEAHPTEIKSNIKKSVKDMAVKPLRILPVDDMETNRKFFSLALSSMGNTVDVAANGEEAIKTFEPGKYDLVFMDIQMPVMDGITATKLLREKYDNLPPIVGLSANAFEGDREKYMNQGLDEYLTKPITVQKFMDFIHSLFSEQKP